MTSIWDAPGMEAPPEPAFVKLDKPGDGFAGTIVNVTKVEFEEGDVAPQITFIDDADGAQKDWTVGATDAKRKCAELRPEAGDHISVRFTGLSGKFKHINVTVDSRGYSQGQQQAGQQEDQQQAQQQAVNLPTHAQPAPVGQSYQQPSSQTYQAVPPPVYAANGGSGNGNGASTPAPGAQPPAVVGPPPPGVDADLWARMAPEQRALLSAAVGATVPF